VHHALFLDAVQIQHLLQRVEAATPPPSDTGRPLAFSGGDALRVTLFAFRHNLPQRATAALLGVSQSTVCRAIARTRTALLETLGPEITRAGNAGAALDRLLEAAGPGRPAVVLLDGTLIPVADRAWDPENYSGKHRRMGRSIQVLADVTGRLLHVGAPQAGRLHDARAVAESGLLAALRADERLLPHADRAYAWLGLITPYLRPHDGDLTPEQRAENREISGIRNAVERTIAHLKVLAVLRTGIRTRAVDRERVIVETISVCVGLVMFRQDWTSS
jgi:hypothetical protein